MKIFLYELYGKILRRFFSFGFYCSLPRDKISSQPSIGVLPKWCSGKMQQMYRRTPMSIKLLCNFIEIALRHDSSPVNLLYIFGTPFPKNTSGGLHLKLSLYCIQPISALRYFNMPKK